MAIIIEANYSKKLGLPAYSSHSYSVTIRSEVADLSQVERESAKLYAILQGSVDREIQEVGFIPDGNGNGSTTPRTTNGHASQSNGDQWACSDKQKDLILRVVDEYKLDKQEVESLAKEMFNTPVKTLNKLQASGLIEELLNKYGPAKTNGGNGNSGRSYQRGGRLFDLFGHQSQRIEAYKNYRMKDKSAHDLVIRAVDVGACTNRMIPEIVKEWREPRHPDFKDRTAWSLFNAFTETLKGNLTDLPKRTQVLHALFDTQVKLPAAHLN